MAVIFYGLGGMGTGVLLRIKKKMEMKPELKENIDKNVFFFGIDIQTDYDIDKVQTNIDRCIGLEIEDPNSVINEKWKKEKSFREWWIKNPDGTPWQSPGPIIKDREGGKIRVNGKLVFCYQYEYIRNFVDGSKHKVGEALGEDREAERRADVIFVVCSLGGGTGSGMLIDFIFLLRDIFGEAIPIYGVFLDGTITEKVAPGSGIQSIGALVEIERWMLKPSEFKMVYYEGEGGYRKLPSRDIPFSKFLDGVLLVQYYNKDNRCFYGRKTGQIHDDYKNLVAEFLYIWANSPSQIIRTTLTNFLNRLPNLPNLNERVWKYGSFGISSIVFPYEYLAKRAVARIIKENIKESNKLTMPEIEEADFSTFVNNLGLNENTLRLETPKFREIENRFNLGKTNVEYAKKGEIIRVIRDNKLNIFSEWRALFETYEREIKEVIFEQLLPEIQGKLKDEVKKRIFTLHFKKIKDWLTDLEGYFKKQKEKKSKTNLPIPTDQHLYQILDDLETFTQKPLSRKWQECRDIFIEEFTKFKNNSIEEIKNRQIIQLYEALITHIELLQSVISYLEEIVDKVLSKFSEDFQTERETLVDREREKLGDYPLTIEVRTRSIEESCKESIEGKVPLKEIERKLKEGVDDTHPGIPMLFETIYKAFYQKSEEEKIKFKTTEKDELLKNVNELFSTILIKEAEEGIYKISIWESLMSYAEDLYKKVEKATEKDLEKLKTQISLDFIKDAAAELLNKEKLKDEEMWKIKAIAYLITRFVILTKPFYQTDEGKLVKRNKIPEFEHLSYETLFSFYAPPNCPYLEKLKPLLINIREENKKFEFQDKHQIAFMGMEFATPLYALKNSEFINYNNSYLSHVKTFPMVGGTPVHTDMRFYNEWKDNILSEQPITTTKDIESVLLYAFGIGTGKIIREKNKFKYQGEILALSLPKLIERLKIADSTIKKLKEEIKTEIEKRLAGKGETDKIKEIQIIFANVYKFHEDIKPGTTGYTLWIEIGNKIKTETTTEGIIITSTLGEMVPKNIEDIKRILELLEL